jgi:hypothetical protein
MSTSVYSPQSIIGFDHTNGVSMTSTLDYITDPVKIENLIARIQALEAWTRLVSLSAANDTKSLSFPASTNVKLPTNERILGEAAVTNALPTAPATPEPSAVEPVKNEDIEVANKILDIIESYGISEKTDPTAPCEARNRFRPIILSYIEKGAAVPMVLPAFPFKSPNREGKALGALPDLGEEIALAHLQGFCDGIKQVYKHGAEISIASDGLVYNGERHGSQCIV